MACGHRSIRTPHPRADVPSRSPRSAGSLAGSTVRPSRSGGNRRGAGRPSEYDGWHGCPATAGRRSAESCSPMSRAIANDGLRSSEQSGHRIRAQTCRPAARGASEALLPARCGLSGPRGSTQHAATVGIRWLARMPRNGEAAQCRVVHRYRWPPRTVAYGHRSNPDATSTHLRATPQPAKRLGPCRQRGAAFPIPGNRRGARRPLEYVRPTGGTLQAFVLRQPPGSTEPASAASAGFPRRNEPVAFDDRPSRTAGAEYERRRHRSADPELRKAEAKPTYRITWRSRPRPPAATATATATACPASRAYTTDGQDDAIGTQQKHVPDPVRHHRQRQRAQPHRLP